MNKQGMKAQIDRDRRDMLAALALGSGALLCPRVLARTLASQAGADESAEAAFNQEAFDLWSNRLVGSPADTRAANPEPDEPAFFYYLPDKGFLPVDFDTDGKTDLGQMLPATSTNMKIAVNIVRPNREHFDFIKRKGNGTLGISIVPFTDASPAKAESAGDTNAKAGATGSDSSSDHLISSVLPPPLPFDYHVSYPGGPSLVTNGAPMHGGLGNWAWTFTVQDKPPKWQTFMTDLQAALGGQSTTPKVAGNKTQAGGKSQPSNTTFLGQAMKFVEGGVGSWETLSFLGVGLKVFNGIIGKTMSQNGKPQVLLTLPNYQIITSKAGRKTADGSALPLPEGEYVAVPTRQIDSFPFADKKYWLWEGVIAPTGSKDSRSALEEALLPANGEAGKGLTYVSFSVKFS